MKRTLLAAVAIAVAAFGAPADAACNGCGGAAAPGSASISLNGSGQLSYHTLTASCYYQSTPNNSGYVGSLSTSARAGTAYDLDIAVAVYCSLSADSSYTASAQGTNSTPFEAWASEAKAVPPLMPVRQICLRADAVWHWGGTHDAASVNRCIYRSIWGQVDELQVEIPIGQS